MSKLTQKEQTAAIRAFARRHGYYARTVRAVSDLRYRAIAEYRASKDRRRARMAQQRAEFSALARAVAQAFKA